MLMSQCSGKLILFKKNKSDLPSKVIYHRFFFQHQVELQLILKYSPFRTETELFEYFDKITGKGKNTQTPPRKIRATTKCTE